MKLMDAKGGGMRLTDTKVWALDRRGEPEELTLVVGAAGAIMAWPKQKVEEMRQIGAVIEPPSREAVAQAKED
jgi:hypothetical protein